MIQLLSVADMRESDKCTIAAGTESKVLMYRAGEAIFNIAKDFMPPFAIVCGNGNNAGDGYVLATLLHKEGIDCSIIRISERFSSDGQYYYDQCKELQIDDISLEENVYKLQDILENYNTIVDCIFGTGFHGDVRQPERFVIEAINLYKQTKNITDSMYNRIAVENVRSDCHTGKNSLPNIISVDINSGLNGDSGLCNICVHSDITISIGNMKPGHLLGDAKDICKKVINCDIGIVPIQNCENIYLIEASDIASVFAPRLNNTNKGTYGYIGLVGGSQLYSGAIRLANIAACAMRSGSGVVKVAAPSSLGHIIIPALLESTFYPLSSANEKLVFNKQDFDGLLNLSSIAFGMGIVNTDETKKALEYLILNYTGTLIIDADGLNALSQMDKNMLMVAACKIIITPHPKEFSRLTGASVDEILCRPISYAADFAKQYHVIVLLKGCSTIITNGELTYISERGSAGMATAGSGDILSGVVAAVCGYYSSDLLLATTAASYITGIAGELASEKYGDISMIASDTANFIPDAIKSIK